MELSRESEQSLRAAIVKAVCLLVQEPDFEVITDIHLYLDADTGKVSIYDDEDSENSINSEKIRRSNCLYKIEYTMTFDKSIIS